MRLGQFELLYRNILYDELYLLYYLYFQLYEFLLNGTLLIVFQFLFYLLTTVFFLLLNILNLYLA